MKKIVVFFIIVISLLSFNTIHFLYKNYKYKKIFINKINELSVGTNVDNIKKIEFKNIITGDWDKFKFFFIAEDSEYRVFSKVKLFFFKDGRKQFSFYLELKKYNILNRAFLKSFKSNAGIKYFMSNNKICLYFFDNKLEEAKFEVIIKDKKEKPVG